MPPLERNLARILHLIDVGRAQYRIRGNAFLDPLHHGRQHVPLRVQRRIAGDLLPDERRARSTSAVSHAADAEEAVEVVQLGVVQAHGFGDVLVVARRVEARDNVVLLAVVVQDLGALVLDGRQVPFPGLDVEGVRLGEVGVVLRVECGRVPGGVVVKGVAHPVGGEGEGLAGVVEVLRDELGAGLHGRVHEAAVLVVVQGGEGLADGLGLGGGEARGRVAARGTEEGAADVVLAQGGVFDDAVDVAVDGVALGEDVLVDDGPHGQGHEG